MNAAAAELRGVSVRLRGGAFALDGVDVGFEPGRIHALLGRNGAGKSTLLRILAGQQAPTSGDVRVLGADPFDNVAVLPDVCLVRDHQDYPDGYRVRDALRLAARTQARFDGDVAERLLEGFDLPPRQRIGALSRGKRGAVGLVVGLASRARITLLDEPYLGLDSLGRRFFADELLADFAEHPRTIVLSTHQVNEFSGLIERVVLLDDGRVRIDADADALRGSVIEVSGRSADVHRFCVGRDVLSIHDVGGVASGVVAGRLDELTRSVLVANDLSSSVLSLQALTDDLLASPAPARPADRGERS